MPELMRAIASRLRELVGNRRRAPRFVTRLEAGLALTSTTLPNAKNRVQGTGQPLTLVGHTRDISATGLALIMPAIRIGGQYITGQNHRLTIQLKLPAGQIEVEATPVRYSPADEGPANTGYLIGVQINGMSDHDRSLFNAYLATLTKE
jgi:hypothetical protein